MLVLVLCATIPVACMMVLLCLFVCVCGCVSVCLFVCLLVVRILRQRQGDASKMVEGGKEGWS